LLLQGALARPSAVGIARDPLQARFISTALLRRRIETEGLMRHIPALAGLALAVTAALPAAAQMATISPAQIGEIFCIARLGNDMDPVEALLTPSLTGAIAEAERLDAEWAAANPGDKPPLGDGIPWQSAPDYASSCQVGT